MNDEHKTREQLLTELAELRSRISHFEKAEVEHKRTEEALFDSRERYRSLVEGSPN